MPVPNPPRANLQGARQAMSVDQTLATTSQLASRIGELERQGGAALGAGLAGAGQAIGAGIAASKDPRNKALKLAAEAQSKRLQQEQAAGLLKESGKEQSLRETFDLTGAKARDSDIAKAIVTKQRGASYWDRMPQSMKDMVTSTISQGGLGIKSYVRPENKALEGQAGTLATQPELAGETPQTFMNRGGLELASAVKQMLQSNPQLAQYSARHAQQEMAAAQARQEGKDGLAQVYEQTRDPRLQAAAQAAYPHVFGNDLPQQMNVDPTGKETQGFMSMREWLARGPVTPEAVDSLRGKRFVKANRFQLDTKGEYTSDPTNTPFYKSIKEKGDRGLKATVDHYKGSGQAALGYAMNKAATSLYQQFLSGSLIDRQSQADTAHWNSFKQDVRDGKINEQQAIHWISQYFFGNETPFAAVVDPDDFMGGRETAEIMSKRMGAWMSESPALSMALDPQNLRGANGLLTQEYRKLQVENVPAKVKGPLDFLDTYQIDSGAAAEVLNMFRKSMQQDPAWSAFDKHLQSKGLDSVARQDAMAQVYEPWRTKVTRMFEGRGPDGKPVRAYSDEDKLYLMKAMADQMVRPYLEAKDVREQNQKKLPSPSGKAAPYTRRQAEQAIASRASPGWNEGLRSYDVGKNRRILVENGRVTGMKVQNDKGEWEMEDFAGDNPEDQLNGDSLALALKLVREDQDWSQASKAAINWKLNGVGKGREMLTGLLNAPLGDGTPLYNYVWSMVQHFEGDNAAAAQGLRQFMAEYAAKNSPLGQGWSQLLEQLSDAGRDTKDPVLHVLEMLVAEGTNATKSTVRDLKQAEAPMRTELQAPQTEPPVMNLEAAIQQRQAETTPTDQDFLAEYEKQGLIPRQKVDFGYSDLGAFGKQFGAEAAVQGVMDASWAGANLMKLGGRRLLEGAKGKHGVQFVKPWEKL